jgi:hypothetical protein
MKTLAQAFGENLMNRKLPPLILAGSLLFLGMAACALLPALTPGAPGDSGALYTQAAQTISAQLTQSAVITPDFPATDTTAPPTATSEADAPTDTAVPTDTPTATPTATATATNTPTPTPVPPTATPTPIPCNWAQFVEDLSVKDGTVFTPDSIFTKTWRLKNIGTCTWTGDYSLIFAGGDRMDAPRAISFSESVRPGETVDLSVELMAPGEEGRYRSYWQLADDAGNPFGIGSDAEDAFWAEIKVVKPDKYAYDFMASYCEAQWRSDAGRLECPGDQGDKDGFAVLLDNPVVEVNRLENETALWTRPEDVRDGWIRGEYPEFKVAEGMHFKGVVGCLDESPECDVIFQLNYRIGDGDLKNLWETREVYDDAYTKVDVDLSDLAGEKVHFVLTVLANGSPKNDNAFWLVPRIVDTTK